MTYPISLDEVSEKDLRDEFKRRIDLRIRGLCDYCGQTPESPICKFPGRHQRDLTLLKQLTETLVTDEKIQETQARIFNNGTFPSI